MPTETSSLSAEEAPSAPAPAIQRAPETPWVRHILSGLVLFLALFTGLNLRTWTWKHTARIRFSADIQNAYRWGSRAAAEGVLNLYQRVELEANDTGRHNIKFTDVRLSSQYILSGDCTGPAAYIPPFGIAHYTTVDVDKSDEDFEHLLFANEPNGLNIHTAGNNVLFADGHVACFSAFDVSVMTYDVNDMKAWSDVRP